MPDPLARGLYVYLLKNPNTPIDTLSGEFVKYILSRDGQAQAKRGGYYPITRNIREHELTRLGLLASAEWAADGLNDAAVKVALRCANRRAA